GRCTCRRGPKSRGRHRPPTERSGRRETAALPAPDPDLRASSPKGTPGTRRVLRPPFPRRVGRATRSRCRARRGAAQSSAAPGRSASRRGTGSFRREVSNDDGPGNPGGPPPSTYPNPRPNGSKKAELAAPIGRPPERPAARRGKRAEPEAARRRFEDLFQRARGGSLPAIAREEPRIVESAAANRPGPREDLFTRQRQGLPEPGLEDRRDGPR